MTTHCHTTIKAQPPDWPRALIPAICHFSVSDIAFPLGKLVTPPKTLPWTDKFCQIVRKLIPMRPAFLLCYPQLITAKRRHPPQSTRATHLVNS
jgi:hypothetical protein